MDTVSDATNTTVCSDLSYCTSVIISGGSTFTDVPYGYTVEKEARLVSSSNGLRNLGYIVTLDDSTRWSSLEVHNSFFRRIKAPFDGCDPYDSLIAIDDSRVQPEGSLNNFR